jgi:hypothetical protein
MSMGRSEGMGASRLKYLNSRSHPNESKCIQHEPRLSTEPRFAFAFALSQKVTQLMLKSNGRIEISHPPGEPSSEHPRWCRIVTYWGSSCHCNAWKSLVETHLKLDVSGAHLGLSENITPMCTQHPLVYHHFSIFHLEIAIWGMPSVIPPRIATRGP